MTNLIFNLGINKATFDKSLELIRRRDIFGYGTSLDIAPPVCEYKPPVMMIIDEPECQS